MWEDFLVGLPQWQAYDLCTGLQMIEDGKPLPDDVKERLIDAYADLALQLTGAGFSTDDGPGRRPEERGDRPAALDLPRGATALRSDEGAATRRTRKENGNGGKTQ